MEPETPTGQHSEPDSDAETPDAETTDTEARDAETTDAEQAIGRKRLAAAARLAYLAALAAALVWLLSRRGDDIARLLQHARPGWVAAALVATFGLIVLTSRFWVIGLRMLGHEASLATVAGATARALPARYIPAGISYPAARVALLRARGIQVAPLAVTAALETVVRPAVALAVGTALLAVSGSLDAGPAWVAAAVAAAAGMAVVSPTVGGRLLARLAARRGVSLTITWRGLARLAAADSLYWAWAAGAFVLYLRAFAAADGFGVLQAAGAFMVAWAVGFLAVFAPQGLGVAEVSLVGLLAAGDDGATLALAVVFGGYRLVLACRDLLAAVAAEIIARRRARRGSAPTD